MNDTVFPMIPAVVTAPTTETATAGTGISHAETLRILPIKNQEEQLKFNGITSDGRNGESNSCINSNFTNVNDLNMSRNHNNTINSSNGTITKNGHRSTSNAEALIASAVAAAAAVATAKSMTTTTATSSMTTTNTATTITEHQTDGTTTDDSIVPTPHNNVLEIIDNVQLLPPQPPTVVHNVIEQPTTLGISSTATSTSTTAASFASASAPDPATKAATASKISHSREENWEHMFNALTQYKKEYGHCLVPKTCPEYKSLSHWVYRQRSLFMTRKRKGEKKNTLTPDRIERLNKLGFVFRARNTKEQSQVDSQRRKPASDANWMKNFELLCEFKESTGHTLVPKVYKTNQTFSSWVYTQRHLYKKRQEGQTNVLTDERINSLNSINFVWNAKKDRQWQDKDRNRKIDKVKDLWQKYFDELVRFREVHGHTMVPKVYQENQALSSWVFRQRKHFRLREQGKAHSMTDQRFEQLNDIKFQFRVRGPRAPNKKKATQEQQEQSETQHVVEETTTASACDAALGDQKKAAADVPPNDGVKRSSSNTPSFREEENKSAHEEDGKEKIEAEGDVII